MGAARFIGLLGCTTLKYL